MLSPGTRVRRYEVKRPLGAGGMGEVYLARDVELDRTVALKILPQTDGDKDGDERISRFLQEAKAAIALNHPNIAHVYDAGDDNGVRFIAMELVEGETLRERMLREKLTVAETIEIGIQIAGALASAHAAGIVHRDIKPENVMLHPDGYVKVVDFGLAKVTTSNTDSVKTTPGLVMGTMHYMSPEQVRGHDVDARSDVFSLGVLLYELANGDRPFQASTTSGIIAAILTDDPPPLDTSIPYELRAAIQQALSKNPSDRFQSAREMGEALKRARHASTARIRSGDMPTQVMTASDPIARKRRSPMLWIAALVLIALAVAGAWYAMRARRIADAQAQLPKIEQLAEERRYFEAWDLGKSIEPVAGRDPRLVRALDKASIGFNATTEPAGARVTMRRVLPDGELGPREATGTTPLKAHLVARGNYIVAFEKEGYAAAERPWNASPLVINGNVMPIPPRPIAVKLAKGEPVPEGMVAVDGGDYQLTGWLVLGDETLPLDPFFIDKHEVSNAQFEKFVRAGGYRRRELWKHPFVKDGRTLTFEEAMTHFRDATGLPGPRSWAQGKYPAGRENHPVTDVSWLEAAAYAELAGKKLPTIYQWDKVARNGGRSPFGSMFPWGVVPFGEDITRRANFRSGGTMPVDSLPSGMSQWGVYHLAGNVTEWLRNSVDDGKGTIGAAFDDPTYLFGYVGSYPPMFASPKIGFRCVKESGDGTRDQGEVVLSHNEKPPVYTPIDDAGFEKLRARYDYPPSPLNAKLLARVETTDWVREEFSYTGGGGQTSSLFLWLPKGAKPPYQLIHFVPAGDVANGARPLEASTEDLMGGAVRGGRALVAVRLEGYIGRSRPATSTVITDSSSESIRDQIRQTVDLRRGLDLVAARKELDPGRLAFIGVSAGAAPGWVLCAVDKRYRAVALVGSGYHPKWDRAPAIVRSTNFIPRIAAPKLVIHGRYDEAHPLKRNTEPIYALMRGEKRMELYDGGHIPDANWMLTTLTRWLDEKFGPVTQ